MVVGDVELHAIHGGTLRVFVANANESAKRSPRVDEFLDVEKRAGLRSVDYYWGLAERVERLKQELCDQLRALKAEGKRIAAYGAAAKGSILLNYMNIGNETLDFVVDKSPHKQGRLMPGVHIPILPPNALVERDVDFVLLLVWNIAEEIIEQQREFRDIGGRFIVPLPELRIV